MNRVQKSSARKVFGIKRSDRSGNELDVTQELKKLELLRREAVTGDKW